MPRYKQPRGPYERHPSSPKEAALRAVISDRYKRIERELIVVDDLPTIYGFPAFINDTKGVTFLNDGSLSIRLTIPASYVDDIHKYIPYIAGQPMAVTMEPIKVTLEDLQGVNDR